MQGTVPGQILPSKVDYTRRLRRRARSIMFWLKLGEQDVLDIFASLPRAQQVGVGDKQFVYVEGTRDDRVLLVAHADTVFRVPVDPRYSAGKFYSGNKQVGIGADDRAGCAILWRLREMGHSLLICNKEEIGCVGSQFFMEDKIRGEKLNESHKFAIQFDRRGANDLVYYSVGSDPFNTWCEQNFTGYKKAYGSSTDIRRLCKTMCGVNISTGYYNEHGSSEHLIEKDWTRTLETARKVLEMKNLPRFEQPPPTVYNNNYSNYQNHQNYSGGRGYYPVTGKQYNLDNPYPTSPTQRPASPIESSGGLRYNTDTVVVCTGCKGIMDEIEYEENRNQCVFCSRRF